MNPLDLNSYDYSLPQDLIAQEPLLKRDSCKLLVANSNEKTYFDCQFNDLVKLLTPLDVLVINTSKVRRARLYLTIEGKKNKERKIEVLLLERNNDHWSALCRPGKKVKECDHLCLNETVKLKCLGRKDDIFFLTFEKNGKNLTREKEEELIEQFGHIPLPPYIRQDVNFTTKNYQTVYNKKIGSAASPTAGLHFTQSLLKNLKEKGVEIIDINLDVGVSTFKPVKTATISNHIMHAENYTISEKTAELLNEFQKEGRKIQAVGTTSLRALEANWLLNQKWTPGSFRTNIFIHPPHKIKSINGLITNFHLPKSTLLMLVSAVAGYDFTKSLYQYAINKRYRFYSFGDAMFIRNVKTNLSPGL